MKTFYIELSKKGIEIFKGGNIEVMIKPLSLNPIKTENIKKAKEILYNKLNETLGTSSLYLYEIREV